MSRLEVVIFSSGTSSILRNFVCGAFLAFLSSSLAGLFFGVGVLDCPQEVFLMPFLAATSEGNFPRGPASCVSALLGESRNLSSRPILPACSLPDRFHALMNKSMELLFQVWRKVRGRRLQDNPSEE